MMMKLWPRFIYALALLFIMMAPATTIDKKGAPQTVVQKELLSDFSHFSSNGQNRFENSVSVDTSLLPFLGLLEFRAHLLFSLNFCKPVFKNTTNFCEFTAGPSPPSALV